MEFQTIPLNTITLQEAATLFNRSFEGYFIPVQFTENTFNAFTQRDAVDFEASPILQINGESAGLALIARRENVSRLGGFGIISKFRGQKAGTWLTQQLLADARQRDETKMFLEVITQNEYAIRLYEKHGFVRLRQLLGFKAENPDGSPDSGLKACNQDLVLDLIRSDGLPDLPWQVDAETLNRVASFGYQLGEAFALISDPSDEHVTLRSLIVPIQVRGQGQGASLLKALFAQYPGKTWHVPAVFPEETGKTFEQAGMQPEPLSQWQMVCKL